MKTDKEITDLLQRRKFEGTRYAAINRISKNRFDAQAWLFLAQAMIGLKRGNMARQCFERASLFDPNASWLNWANDQVASIRDGQADKEVLQLLTEIPVTVSACVLTRNNADTIGDCIEALKPAVDEIIVVDTGSTDDTIQVIESLGVNVHHFEWVDDFSSARNHAQSLANSDWVIHVDSDEILSQEDTDSIRISASIADSDSNCVIIHTIVASHAEGKTSDIAPLPRMHKNDGSVMWEHLVHEYPVCQKEGQKILTPAMRIRFEHRGYDIPQDELNAKYERNLKLLLRDLEQYPNDVRTLYFIGREYMFLQDFEKSLTYLQDAKTHGETSRHVLLPDIIHTLEYVTQQSVSSH